MITGKNILPSVLMMIALGAPGLAFAQEACTTYVVKEGESLGDIAMKAYGSYNYQIIFNANRDQLVSNLSSLPGGMNLILPCLDGRLTPDQALNEVSTAEAEKQAERRVVSDTYNPPLKFISGNEWQPFADEGLTGGGILVRLATTALQRGGNDREATMAWVDDWGSHLDTLLPSGAYDVSIAWSMPDCTKLDMLGETSARRCTDFEASLPIYEVAESISSLATNKYAEAKVYADLAGARICRPADWSAEDLEVEGLVDPVVTMVRPVAPEDCAKMLLDGEADVFSIELETATKIFEDMGAMDKMVINPSLVKVASYRFLTSKSNPRAKIYMAMLNKGIVAMRESGEWYDIVATGLAEYNAASN